MEVVFERVCGLDVHKETVVACVRWRGTPRRKEVRTFGAHRQGIVALRAWLEECEVQGVAMEGTGIYWRPVYSALEGGRWTLIVGNAQHVKNVPGRKTDVKDAEWLADLVAHGLIRPSFIPPPDLRELRDVTRFRTSLISNRTRARNRVLKVLQLAGIKLDGVASDAFGKSGMAILRALSEGKATPQEMANLARGQLRKKIDALTLALESPLSATHQQLLTIALDELAGIERHIATCDALIAQLLAPYASSMDLLVTLPGVDQTAAATIVAELGPDMSVFPTAGHAASWAGVCPGNHESAGQRASGTTTKGNRHLKTMLCQSAHAAARMKKGYLRDKYYRMKARRGHNRAIMCIAHKLLVAAYHMLQTGRPYKDLGDSYLDLRDVNRTVDGLATRIRNLGFDVTITPAAPAAHPSVS